MEKYDFSEQDANDMTNFLVPILDFVPEKRPTAAQCLLHPWINVGPNIKEPSVSSTQKEASNSSDSEKQEKRKVEREAIERGIAKISISTDSKSVIATQTSKLTRAFSKGSASR